MAKFSRLRLIPEKEEKPADENVNITVIEKNNFMAEQSGVRLVAQRVPV